jgi:5,10-methylenetetrahydrofolate reductase
VSRLTAALAAGRFVLTTSLGTLPNPDPDDLRRKLSEVRERFDCVKFADNPRARARVSPWAAASVAVTEGVEPIVHVTCRDRNRLALESDLLGGRLLGVPNLLCLRGDEIEVTNEPAAHGVRDTDVVELIRMASRSSGRYTVLAACDPNVRVTESHFARLAEKVAAGARVLETQPIFDVCRFATWLAHLREAGIDVPLLVDVSVVGTVQEAELLARIPFVQAPDDLAMRLRHDRSAGIELAAQTVGALRELDTVAGCHLSPLSGEPDLALAVLDRSGPPRE